MVKPAETPGQAGSGFGIVRYPKLPPAMREVKEYARRASFTNDGITADQLSDTLLKPDLSYKDFSLLLDKAEALPILWACRNDWIEAATQNETLKNTNETLQTQIESATELDADVQTELVDVQIELRDQKLLNDRNEQIILELRDKVREGTPFTQTSSSGGDKRSSKIPDPSAFTDGKKNPSFDAWKRAVRNKLRANADHYPTDLAKLGYVLSRIDQPASDVLEPYIDDDAIDPFTKPQQVYDLLEQVYGTPNKEQSYQVKFEQLKQQGMDFNLFVADFYRLSAPLDRNNSALVSAFKSKLTPVMYNHIIGRQDKQLVDLVEYCRGVDEDLKAKQLRTAAVVATPTQTQSRSVRYPQTTLSNEAPDTVSRPRTYNPAFRNNAPGNRTNTTVAERQEMMRTGQCFKCKKAGHMSRDCPGTAQASAVEEQLTENEVPLP